MNKNIFIFCIFFSVSVAFATGKEQQLLRRIRSHFLVEDFSQALEEAKNGINLFPNSPEMRKNYLLALARKGKEGEVVNLLNNNLDEFSPKIAGREFLEEVAWEVIEKGVNSTQYTVRLASIIGAYATHDAKAVNILLAALNDSNAILRSVAVQLAADFGDEPLKKKIGKLLEEEKVYLVRLEVIRSVGKMRIKEKAKLLQNIISNDKSTFEEKGVALESLVQMYDGITAKEIQFFANSEKAGLRRFSCQLATHFEVKEVQKEIFSLLLDPRPDVRVFALNAIALYYRDFCNKKQKNLIISSATDSDPVVAITSAWVMLFLDQKIGEKYLRKWLNDPFEENRRLAAAALAAGGEYAVDLSKKIIRESSDPYVRANVALGLIGQKESTSFCCDILYEFLQNKSEMWMIDESKNNMFSLLCPSRIRHIDQIPNYPEGIDMMAQLNLASVLAICGDRRIEAVIKDFLLKKKWGITGVAAVTLLQEGDEEALDLIRSLLQKKDPFLRTQAALVLALFGKDPSVIPILEEAYVSAEHEMKIHILEAMGFVGNAERFPFFINVLKEPFQILRVVNASSLIQCLNR